MTVNILKTLKKAFRNDIVEKIRATGCNISEYLS